MITNNRTCDKHRIQSAFRPRPVRFHGQPERKALRCQRHGSRKVPLGERRRQMILARNAKTRQHRVSLVNALDNWIAPALPYRHLETFQARQFEMSALSCSRRRMDSSRRCRGGASYWRLPGRRQTVVPNWKAGRAGAGQTLAPCRRPNDRAAAGEPPLMAIFRTIAVAVSQSAQRSVEVRMPTRLATP
jgi:hypothetical protein